ncbi:MAG: hypothetical protein O6940_04705 [Ignavibacteria bacterium]|nr:hypothetical protein [Ignavibacteria bacterium]
MDKEIALMNVNVELTRAKKALEEGNIGMARVCARRACRISISFWLQHNLHSGYGESAMNQLKSIQNDESVPAEIKDAARRLSTHVSDQTTLPISDNPVGDAELITKHFLEH